MPRRAAKVDVNQPSIVEALRRVNASVCHIHMVGRGVPDILVGVEGLTLVGKFNMDKVKEALAGIPGVMVIEGANLLQEIKSSEKATLTDDEELFFKEWKGQVSRVNNEREALFLIGWEARV